MNRFGESVVVDTPDVQTAIALVREGTPLPVDLTARLLEEGVDVENLINQYED